MSQSFPGAGGGQGGSVEVDLDPVLDAIGQVPAVPAGMLALMTEPAGGAPIPGYQKATGLSMPDVIPSAALAVTCPLVDPQLYVSNTAFAMNLRHASRGPEVLLAQNAAAGNITRRVNVLTGAVVALPAFSSSPQALQAAGIATVGDHSYFVGGWLSGSGVYDNGMRRFNWLTNTWTSLANMPAVLAWCPSVHVDGQVYVFGGRTTGNVEQVAIRAYSVANNTWRTLAATLPAVIGTAANVIRLGQSRHILICADTGPAYIFDAITETVSATDAPAAEFWGAAAMVISGAEGAYLIRATKIPTTSNVATVPDYAHYLHSRPAGSRWVTGLAPIPLRNGRNTVSENPVAGGAHLVSFGVSSGASITLPLLIGESIEPVNQPAWYVKT